MNRKPETGETISRGAAFGAAILCLCLSFVFSFGLGLALTAESNGALLKRQAVIEQQNILPVPGPPCNEELSSLLSAACAAVFYAFSLGIGLPALLLPCLYFFRGTGVPKAVKWVLVLSVVAILGYSLDHRMPGLYGSLFALGTGFWVYLWLFRSGSGSIVKTGRILRALPGFTGAALLLLLIPYSAGIRDFASVRDAFLVNNDWTRPASDFYYRYTLMAAEPIKPPARKTQPLCVAPMERFEERERNLIKRSLNKIGVIPVAHPIEDEEYVEDWILTNTPPYLTVTEPGTGETERIEMHRISSLPNVLLDARWGGPGIGLRFWVGSSLFVVIPGIALGGAALLITRLLRVLARLSGKEDSAIWQAVLPVGAVLLAVFLVLHPFPEGKEALTRMALSQKGWAQVRAVRALAGENGTGVDQSETLLRLLNEADARIRYWAAQMVRGNEGKRVMNRLIANMSDPSVHVASASARGLSRFHSPEVPRALRLAYETRTEWYLRDAVYRGLRSRGWQYIGTNDSRTSAWRPARRQGAP